MQGGLTATAAETDGEPGVTTTDGAPEFSTTGVTFSATSESHLDSFFAESGWTRDDVVTAATVLNSVLFIVLVYLEVRG
mgnify:CR=1 FL=1